jgi:hypothetical protein
MAIFLFRFKALHTQKLSKQYNSFFRLVNYTEYPRNESQVKCTLLFKKML